MVSLKGDETPREIIILSYAMEQGLREFYSALALEALDHEVAGMLTKLGNIEETHKQRLFDLYRTLEPGGVGREAFESKTVPLMMEGGFTTDEFLEKHRPVMQSVPDVIGIAMMLEAQALDLYLRYSRKTEDPKSKSVLFGIAEEEKAHLATLGRLIEDKQ